MSSAIASMSGEISVRINAPRIRSSMVLAIHRQSRSGRSMTFRKVWPPIWLAWRVPRRMANSPGQSRTSTGNEAELVQRLDQQVLGRRRQRHDDGVDAVDARRRAPGRRPSPGWHGPCSAAAGRPRRRRRRRRCAGRRGSRSCCAAAVAPTGPAPTIATTSPSRPARLQPCTCWLQRDATRHEQHDTAREPQRDPWCHSSP